MYCIDCGRLKHDKVCLFSKDGMNIIHSFFVSNLLFNSKFNNVYYIYPTDKQYNMFSSLMNIHNTLEIEKLYNEEWMDVLLLVLSNVENLDPLIKHLIFPSLIEDTFEEEQDYFSDIEFNKHSNLERKAIIEKLKNNCITRKMIKQFTGSYLIDLEQEK